MEENKGQNKEVWTAEWKNLSPISEIQMRDFFGLRPWILKYTPREGKVLEAGCGLGRYVFYLSQLGIYIEGLDFSEVAIQFLNNWKKKNGFNDIVFNTGDVLNLPYDNGSLAGYLSFGVIEHFKEGPHEALREACRVLRPGGIAIISTPSISFNIILQKATKQIKNLIKKLIFYPKKKNLFFQYWFGAKKLKKYIENAGLKVTRYDNADLLYAFLEYHNFDEEKIKPGTFAYWFANRFENTFLKKIGAQSITIAVKTGPQMHCFICGSENVTIDSLNQFDVPICKTCIHLDVSKYYKKGIEVKFDGEYSINPPIISSKQQTCEYCNKKYTASSIFEKYGFSRNVCPICLKDKKINIELSNNFVKPIWRNRKNKKKQGES